jgi:repressor LexA
MTNQYLTAKQHQILQKIKEHIKTYKYAPTIGELMEVFGFASKRAITYHLEVLEKRGLISRSSESRGIQVLDKIEDNFLSVPLLGFANAGTPLVIAQEEYMGELTVDKSLLTGSDNIFAVELKGDSMNRKKFGNTFLQNGSYVIVSKGAEVTDNDTVLALIDGCATVKVFKKMADLITLLPDSDNPVHKPIYVSPSTESTILGKIVGVLDNPMNSLLGFKA